jgi:hypothetical protein
MRVARTLKGLTHGNKLVLRRLKVYFQRFPGKHGSDTDRGIADVEYTFKVGGRVIDKGKTATDGSIEILIAAEQTAELEIFGTTFTVKIDNHLPSASDVTGHQRRLSMLGYDLGDVDGSFGQKTDRAALDFQADEGLEPDGIVGPSTQSKLRSAFGE